MTNRIPRRLLALLLTLLLAMGLSATAFAAEAHTDPVRLNTPDASGNVPFYAPNLFPGDAETRDFTVRVSHREPITLYFHADIRPGSEKLAEVMMVKIELPEAAAVLYDGLMRDMPSALEHPLAADEKEVLYRITAYLDTSVGNDYQYQSLIADFRWWYLRESASGGGGSTPGEPPSASVKLAAEKTMDGRYPRGEDFTFVLKDEAGHVLQTVRNRDGLIEFDALTFDEEGVRLYTVTETPGGDPDIVYDGAVYTAAVTVTEEEGRLVSSVAWEKDGEPWTVLPRFVNKTPGTNPPSMPDNPKTGDSSSPGLWLALLAGSALALLLLLLTSRKKKEDSAHE